MKQWLALILCGLLMVGLCSCGCDISHLATSSNPVPTIGGLVVTDTDGSAVTDDDGSLVTTIVTGLPTSTRPVTDPAGSTVTKEDGTVETEVVIAPYITVSTDASGTTYTSLVPSNTTAGTTTTTTVTTGALVVTDGSGSPVTDGSGSLVTTIVTGLPTSTRPVTDGSGSTVTKDDGTVETEVVVPPHITVSTDASGTTHTSLVPSNTTATTATTASTTQPTAGSSTEQVINGVTVPASGYAADNRIKLGTVSLNGNVLSLVVKNTSKAWETEDGKSYFLYVCYDKDNNMLQGGRINFGYIPVSSEKTCVLTLPDGTAKVALTDFKAEYWSKPVK